MGPSNALALQVASLRRMHGKMLSMDDVSFEVKRGRVVCIIGLDSAGKTPTIGRLEGATLAVRRG